MRNVDVRELGDQLSGYLQYVKDGEEIVIRDHDAPVARILPFAHDSGGGQEAQLVTSGALKMPEAALDWGAFFGTPGGDVSREVAVDAAMQSRGDR